MATPNQVSRVQPMLRNTLATRADVTPAAVTKFENDDPYRTQLEALIAGRPTCTYEQALETYALTWAIRKAGEDQQKKLRS